VVDLDRIPADVEVCDFEECAILPGLVDRIRILTIRGAQIGEGFETATKRRRQGIYYVVDMR